MKELTKNQLNKSSRNWCLTIFKMDTEFNKLFFDNTEFFRYCVYQQEKADTTKKQHYQVYIELFKTARMSKIKKLFCDNTIHCEIKKGSRESARFYCMKNYDGIYNDDYKWIDPLHRGRDWGDTFYELGEWISGQGARSDILKCKKMIDEGDKMIDIADGHFNTFIKFYRGLYKYKNLKLKETTKEFRKIQVEVYWGAAGSGKSKKALYNDDGTRRDDIYILEQRNGTIWYDGYEQEKTLVINDFYGWIKYGQFLNTLDGHQQQLEVKGGITYAGWTKVIITSNQHPKDWYSKGLTSALERRLNVIERLGVTNKFVTKLLGNTGKSLSQNFLRNFKKDEFIDIDELLSESEEGVSKCPVWLAQKKSMGF
jgi:hypothetical protein